MASRIQWKKGTLDESKMKPLAGDPSKIFNAVKASGDNGLTDFEIVRESGVPASTESTRRNELVQKGYLQNSGRKRLTDKGVSAVVWILGDGVPLIAGDRVRRPDREELQEMLASLPPKFDKTKAWIQYLIRDRK